MANIKIIKGSELPIVEDINKATFLAYEDKTISLKSGRIDLSKLTPLFGVTSEKGDSQTLAISQKTFTDNITTLDEAIFIGGGDAKIPVIINSWTEGLYVNINGVVSNLNTYKLSELIPVSVGEKYEAFLRGGSGGGSVIGSAVISGWNNGVFNPSLMIGGTDSSQGLLYTFTIPQNVTHIRLSTALALVNPSLVKYVSGEGKINRIDLLEEDVKNLKKEIDDNTVIATKDNFTGSTTLTGNTTSITGATFRYPVNLAIEDLDFFARVKVITNGKFGLCRTDTTNGTAILVNGNIVEVRKVNSTTGTLIYSYNLPFAISAGNEYVLRLYKKNKDIIFSIHSDTDYFIQKSDRLDTADFGRNWGYPAVFCQTGQIEVLGANIYNCNFVSPLTLAFGDSFYEGWGVVNYLDKRFIALMRDYTGGQVFIAGRGGETTTSLLTRIDTELAKVKSQYVLLGVGTNDNNITTYKNNMATLITKVRALGRIPILVTITPRTNYPIVDMNSYVRASGEIYIDFNKAVNNGTETSWNPIYVNTDNVHPNVAGNEVMFRRLLFDLYFLFDTYAIYEAKLGLNDFASKSNEEGNSIVYAPNGVVSITEETGIGNIQGETTIGGYIQPFTGQKLSSNEYECTDYIDVRPYHGLTAIITGCFAYNSTNTASNAGIAAYSALAEYAYIKSFFNLSDAGITASGRNRVENFEVVIPNDISFIRGSSCITNAGGKETPLVIRIKEGTTIVNTPITDYSLALNDRIKALESGQVSKELDLSNDIEQGTISSVDGSNGANATRIRSINSYVGTVFDVQSLNSGYQYNFFVWENGAFKTHIGWQTILKKWEFPLGTSIRFAFKKTTYANITPSEFSAIGFKVITVGESGGSSTLVDDVISRNKEAEKAVLAVRKQFDTQNTTNETSIFCLAHISDLHIDPTRLANFIKYCEHIGVDAGAATGDIVNLYFTDDFSYYVNQVLNTSIPMFNTIGNHEAQNGGTDEELQAKFFTPIEVQNGATTEGKGYYYRDFADKKIRIIGLNQFQQGGATRERRYYKNDQITWLINTLKSTPANYGVLMLTHIPEHEWSVDSNYSKFWQEQMFFTDLFSNITGSPIADIIDAFIGRSTINKTYAQNGTLTSLSVNGDFSTVANGVEFIAYANGHLHTDRIGYLNNTTYKQLVLNIICGNAYVSSWRDGLGDLPRKSGTVAEDAFNIYGVDRVLKMVKIVRVGSNMSFKMEKRDFMAIPYK